MKAVIGDVHGNLEALEAVLADCERQGVHGIYCLGDLVGYGPNPCECMDLAAKWELTLLGNWDQDLFAGHENYCPRAGQSLDWTLAHMESKQVTERYQAFIDDLPRRHQDGDFLFVHASPCYPLREWLFPEDVYLPEKMKRNFAKVDRYCFYGHTHLPGVFTEDLGFRIPDELGDVYRLDGTKSLINPGSVGQPRDGDSRASYALLNDNCVIFRRVEYDIDTTVKKIYQTDSLYRFFGDRLRDGR
jgi:diadenosine tetraphosphatase ApaH/serine/threonine PP2A family protein phosphatase